MAVLRPESEMKDSGIEWIGQIPQGWKLARLKDIKASTRYAIVDGPFGSAISTDDYVDEGVPLIRITNLVNGRVSSDNMVFIPISLAETLRRSQTRLNDIIIAKTGGTVGKCAINNCIEDGILSSSCVKISVSEKNDFRYYYYLFSTPSFVEALINACIGTTRNTINLKPLSNLNCTVPPLAEQQAIASYLDDRCSKLDELITEAEKSIEEYKELKQAVIFEAVTKGLDKNVPMKDSGDSWIGNCPIHYHVAQLSMLSTIVRGGSPRPAGDPRYYGGTIPFMRISDITRDDGIYVDYAVNTITEEGFSRTREVPPYTLLLTNSGATLGVPKITTFKTTFNDGIAAFLNVDKRLNIVFAYYFLKAETPFFLENASMGMGQPNLNTDIIGRTHIVLPPESEQLKIVEYLKKNITRIDSLISEKKSLIEDLKAYKKSLIYEVVTGKRRVV